MKAARLYEAGKPLVIEQVPLPEVNAKDVLVAVKAAGICGTDVHIAIEGTLPVAKSPITLGHEGAGEVTAVGSEVTQWRVGDRVCIFGTIPCGECYACREGKEALCPKAQILGMYVDGTFAEYIRIPEECLISLPAGIAYPQAAIITDAVSTAYHAVAKRGRLQPGEKVAIFGCGGLGHHGIIFAKLMGAGKIVAVDIVPGMLKRAQQVGADEIVNAAEEDAADKIKHLTGGEGVHLALEFVGRRETVTAALKSLRRGGRAVVVGVGRERVETAPLYVFVGGEYALIGSMGSERNDLADVLSLVDSGKLDLSASVSETMPLEEVNSALGKIAMRTGDPLRIVVLPQG
ncbi:MAG: zinc-binding dehydrogenase [Chloroflexi bacterium]|nr:zinc-binding dehydrogenase [Chloroflexota bacterium]